ncbi:MAG: hypothetical protein ACI9WU_003726, partial [Myxococcota bacterium]
MTLHRKKRCSARSRGAAANNQYVPDIRSDHLRKPKQVRAASHWSEGAYLQLFEDGRGRWRVLQDHHSSVRGIDYHAEDRGCFAKTPSCDVHPWLLLADALRPDPQTACLLASGVGRQVLDGVRFGLKDMAAIELNPDLLPCAIEHRPQSGLQELMQLPEVRYLVDDARHFIRRSQKPFDLVLLPPSGRPKDMSAPSAADHILTEQAIAEYLNATTDDGLVVITLGLLWHKTQTRPRARVLSILRHGMKRAGIQDPDAHLQAFDPGFFYLSRSAFTAAERLRAATLAGGLGLQPVSLSELESSSGAPTRRITDDYPFWVAAAEWADLPHSLDSLMRPRPGRPGAEGVLFLTHILALLGVIVVLLLPLLRSRAARVPVQPADVAMLAAFGFIGLGFMCMEMPLIEKLVFAVGNPVRSLSFCLFILLLTTGAGSALSARLVGGPDGVNWGRMGAAFLALVGVQLLMWFGLGSALDQMGFWPIWQSGPAIVLLLTPVGLLLGIPFPTATAILRDGGKEALIPWAWAA